jgi:hypothetical protein
MGACAVCVLALCLESSPARCLAHAGSSAGGAADGKAMAVASKRGGEHNNLAWEQS